MGIDCLQAMQRGAVMEDQMYQAYARAALADAQVIIHKHTAFSPKSIHAIGNLINTAQSLAFISFARIQHLVYILLLCA